MNPQKGFSLIELMIVVVIAAILVLVALPSYNNYVVQTRRSEAKTALLSLAAEMERYYNQNQSYAGATLANVNSPTATPDGYYNLQITAAGSTSFTVQAVPTGTQATSDAACASLTYDQLGQKGVTGTSTVANCW